MAFRKNPSQFFGQPLLWMSGKKGHRVDIELVSPPERDDQKRLAFSITSGDRAGDVVHLEDREVVINGRYPDSDIWGGGP